MTEKEFLHRLSKLRKKWRKEGSAIRCTMDGRETCPLVAAGGGPKNNNGLGCAYEAVAVRLGIELTLAARIAHSEDWESGSLRKELLAACKLEKP